MLNLEAGFASKMLFDRQTMELDWYLQDIVAASWTRTRPEGDCVSLFAPQQLGMHAKHDKSFWILVHLDLFESSSNQSSSPQISLCWNTRHVCCVFLSQIPVEAGCVFLKGAPSNNLLQRCEWVASFFFAGFPVSSWASHKQSKATHRKPLCNFRSKKRLINRLLTTLNYRSWLPPWAGTSPKIYQNDMIITRFTSFFATLPVRGTQAIIPKKPSPSLHFVSWLLKRIANTCWAQGIFCFGFHLVIYA